MISRSLRSSLVKLMILIPLILDNMVPSAATNSGNRYQVARRIYLPNAVNASKTFVCKEPQFRAYNLKDLIQNIHHNPVESPVQPIYIVLKRCDGHSGCCMSPYLSCTPVESAIYYEEVEIKIWSLETHERKQWIRVEQHGECFCHDTKIIDRYRRPNVTLVDVI